MCVFVGVLFTYTGRIFMPSVGFKPATPGIYAYIAQPSGSALGRVQKPLPYWENLLIFGQGGRFFKYTEHA